MKQKISISAFFPTLNDAYVLPSLIEKTSSVLSKITDDFEIIVINDGSTDNSDKVLLEQKKRYRNLRIITHKKNMGYGAALIDGFKNATKEWIFYTDGDGQYDPSEIAELVRKIDNADVVNGYKLERKDSLLRKGMGMLYNRLLHFLYDLPISDVDCDFRLIKREYIKKISLVSQSGTICIELVVKLYKVGARFQEVGVHHYEREHGKSEFFKVKNIYRTLIENIWVYNELKKQ